MLQVTLNQELNIAGIGVHSGKITNMVLKPAPVNHGIVFIRVDKPEKINKIPARYDLVRDTKLCTMLINDYGVEVGTVEHLMSALSTLGIDNLLIELDSKEIPILDGSSEIFLSKILEVGVKYQEDVRKILKIVKPVEVSNEKWSIKVVPSNSFIINMAIDFKNKIIGKQEYRYNEEEDNYLSNISRARTFGLLHEIKYLNSVGLALGGNLDNAVVVDENKILNQDGLRYKDEFVRHKILDAVGDFYLSGYKIIGEFFCNKSGHEANNLLLRSIFDNSDCYIIEDMYPFTGVHFTGKKQKVLCG